LKSGEKGKRITVKLGTKTLKSDKRNVVINPGLFLLCVFKLVFDELGIEGWASWGLGRQAPKGRSFVALSPKGWSSQKEAIHSPSNFQVSRTLSCPPLCLGNLLCLPSLLDNLSWGL
jgi:hypothetical protein